MSVKRVLAIVTMIAAWAASADPPAIHAGLCAAPAAAAAGWFPPAWFERSEFGRMLAAVLSGSRMGPNEGWFGPAESRFGWTWLAASFDGDADGRVTDRELKGSRDLFQALDRDGSGSIEAGDLDWSGDSKYLRDLGASYAVFRRFDQSSDGRLSAEEWQAAFQRLAGEQNTLTPEELHRLLFPPSPSRRPAENKKKDQSARRAGPDREVLIKGLFAGELGSACEGPALNQPAPDFELPTWDGKQRIRFSELRRGRPAVLIFGSFT